MAEPVAIRKVFYTFIETTVLLFIMLGVCVLFIEWYWALVFIVLYSAIGSVGRAFQTYYTKLTNLVVYNEITLLITGIFINFFTQVNYLMISVNAVIIIFWAIISKMIVFKNICPTGTIIVYDTEDNKLKAEKLAFAYGRAVHAYSIFEYSDNWEELLSLKEMVETFKIQQLCVCLDGCEYKLLHICKELGLSIIIDCPISVETKKEFHLHMLEWFKNKYFSVMVF